MSLIKGSYRIIIQNRRVHYDFTIKRNITVIKGNSGTGKTTLIDMLAEYEVNGRSSGISVESKKVPEIFKLPADTNVLIVADGAAFGSQMEKVDKLLKQRPNTWLYLPESFEWI